MLTITLISDFGEGSHYIARVKAAIFAEIGFVPILDITHSIPAWDIEKGAFILNSTRKKIKGQAIHFFGINDGTTRFLAAKSEKHWFLAPDNGVIPAILGVDNIQYFSLGDFTHPSYMERLFPKVMYSIEQNTFSSAYPHSIIPKQVKFKNPSKNGNTLYVYLVFVDNYGNAHYNIKREDFYALFGNSGFKILVNEKDSIDFISDSYNEAAPPTLLALFNSAGYLEIASSKGNANRLFGLDKLGYILIIPSNKI